MRSVGQKTGVAQDIARRLVAADVATLRCEGELGGMELDWMCDEIFRLTAEGKRRVVLDLAAVDHVDYRGLKDLATRARALRQGGGDIKLAGASPYLAAIFRAAGVEEQFEFYASADEARLAFATGKALALVRG